MPKNWRNTKFNKEQKRVGFLLGGWLALVISLAILSEANIIDLPNWIMLIILALVVPILKCAYDILPIELFTLRDTEDEDDAEFEDLNSENRNSKQDKQNSVIN